MELWRIYRYVNFVKRKIKTDKEYALESFCYTRFMQVKHSFFIFRFTPQQVIEINDFAIERGYLEAYDKDGRMLRITQKGRDLIEMRGLGFVVEAGKKYSVILSIITGLAAIASVIISLRK